MRVFCVAVVALVGFIAVFAVSRFAAGAGLVPDDAVTLWASAITAGDGEMAIGRIVAAYPTVPFLATTLLEFVTPGAARRRPFSWRPAWSPFLPGLGSCRFDARVCR